MDEKKERFEAYITIIKKVSDYFDDLTDEETSQENKEMICIGISGLLLILKLAITAEIGELKKAQNSTETPQA